MNAEEDGFVKEVDVTAGNVHDSQKLEDVLTGSEEELYADSAYRSKTINEKLAQKGSRTKLTSAPIETLH